MKVIIYTTSDCKFSKEEIEYLKKNKLEYTEKALENNKDNLQEMLSISSNFAGTPVTQIQKDDGQTIVLKGFTRQEFDKALGIGEQPQAQTPDQTPPAQQPTPMASPQTPKEEVEVEPEVKPQEAQPTPAQEEPKPETSAPQPSQTQEPAKPTQPAVAEAPAPQTPMPANDNKDNALDSVLDNLKEKSGNDYQKAENNPPPQNTPPSIPEFPAK